ncbi:DUF397 domain-containing protein [Kitasatospora sp. RB6PN24]|uniref:DUF397 domain-containing protein n=1 Tax=Kitasatospora humi TaxID=2893891 RepID=UPI001E45E4CC|nr:DUF397 domain-containing protein [Kitasatospora humi]MCC9312292.1 DUF397 domain-containing protein [Kitasatospora humi]
MTTDLIPDASALTTWRKSSYSGVNNSNCVEVADGFTSVVPVRDSKNPTGPALVLPANEWSAFISAIKSGTLVCS